MVYFSLVGLALIFLAATRSLFVTPADKDTCAAVRHRVSAALILAVAASSAYILISEVLLS